MLSFLLKRLHVSRQGQRQVAAACLLCFREALDILPLRRALIHATWFGRHLPPLFRDLRESFCLWPVQANDLLLPTVLQRCARPVCEAQSRVSCPSSLTPSYQLLSYSTSMDQWPLSVRPLWL